jgi:hypothetical protein
MLAAAYKGAWCYTPKDHNLDTQHVHGSKYSSNQGAQSLRKSAGWFGVSQGHLQREQTQWHASSLCCPFNRYRHLVLEYPTSVTFMPYITTTFKCISGVLSRLSITCVGPPSRKIFFVVVAWSTIWDCRHVCHLLCLARLQQADWPIYWEQW